MTQIIARSSELPIGPGTKITLHFAIHLTSGEMIDSTQGNEPASFEFGDGNIGPGFEKALIGMYKGEERKISIPFMSGFGDRIPDNVRRMDRKDLSGKVKILEPGLVVSFSSPEGELFGVITQILKDKVEVDFNHPLAGKDLIFDVSIIDVEKLQVS